VTKGGKKKVLSFEFRIIRSLYLHACDDFRAFLEVFSHEGGAHFLCPMQTFFVIDFPQVEQATTLVDPAFILHHAEFVDE